MDIDFLLLQRMKRGDENAFNVFVRKYYKEILNYCNYHCPDTSTAEDLTQETFCAFSRNCLTTVIWEKPKIICIRLLEIFAGIPIKKSEKVC